MFCRNHKFACAANFVGSGGCDDVNECLALLAGAGKKFNVTVEYHTTRAYYPDSQSDGSQVGDDLGKEDSTIRLAVRLRLNRLTCPKSIPIPISYSLFRTWLGRT